MELTDGVDLAAGPRDNGRDILNAVRTLEVLEG